MPNDFTIEVNLNSVGKGTGTGSSGKGPEDTSDENKQRRLSAMRRLGLFNSSQISSVISQSERYQKASPERQAQMAALGKAALGGYAAAKIVGTGWNAVKTFAINNISEKYGDQARQNEINNTLNGLGIAGGIAGSTVGGAAAGALAGPVGAVVGAVIGLVAGVANQTVKSVEASYKWQRQEYENTLNEARQSERLGIDISQRNRTR